MSLTAKRVEFFPRGLSIRPGPFEIAATVKNRRNKSKTKNRRTIEKKRRRAARG
jgi:hypothetical protein